MLPGGDSDSEDLSNDSDAMKGQNPPQKSKKKNKKKKKSQSSFLSLRPIDDSVFGTAIQVNTSELFIIDQTGNLDFSQGSTVDEDPDLTIKASDQILPTNNNAPTVQNNGAPTNQNNAKRKRRRRRSKKKSNSVITIESSDGISEDEVSENKVQIKKAKDGSIITISDSSEEDSDVIDLSDTTIVGRCSGVIEKDPSLPEPLLPKQMPASLPTNSSSPMLPKKKKGLLRPIVIDGCNVAFGHGKDQFSSLGLKICIDYFKRRGHTVKAFVPQFRRRHSATRDCHLLDQLEKEGIVVYTPSRNIQGRMLVSYDDRFIVEYAHKMGGIIVSRDNYRDLLASNPEWTTTITERLLMFTWVDDIIMFPDDPLGRGGPNLRDFLKF